MNVVVLMYAKTEYKTEHEYVVVFLGQQVDIGIIIFVEI